jgi:hypothetical protein
VHRVPIPGQLPGELDSIHSRHYDIQHSKIGLVPLDTFQRGNAVGGGGDNIELSSQQQHNLIQHFLVVVRHYDAQFHYVKTKISSLNTIPSWWTGVPYECNQPLLPDGVITTSCACDEASVDHSGLVTVVPWLSSQRIDRCAYFRQWFMQAS